MCHEQPSIEKLQRTGVVELDANHKVLGMEEKPMSAGRFDIGSLDTYYEAVKRFG
jgi:dTDP-glucose pyrophosphorylase